MARTTLILPLDALPGSSIKDIAQEMIATAKRFDMPVKLSMNGTRLLVFPTSTLGEIRGDYEQQLMAGEEGEVSRG